MLPVGGLAALPLVCWWALWVAAGAGALSVVAVRLPGSPLGGVLMAGAVRHVPPAAQFRRALSPLAARSPACSGAAGRPEKLLRRASPSFLRRARVAATGGLAVARLLCSTALLFPAHRSEERRVGKEC